MEIQDLSYWRLCDELNVIDAALLIVGRDPSGEHAYVENWEIHKRPQGYEAVKKAMQNAILCGRLHAIVRRRAWERGWDEEPGEEYYHPSVHMFMSDLSLMGVPDLKEGIPGESVRDRGVIYRAEPDWNLTTMPVEALRNWLKSRGFRSNFFFSDATNTSDYLDSRHPRYAPKLSAAIQAWHAVEDKNLRRGKSAKSAMEQWLIANYQKLGLVHKQDNVKNGYKAGDMNKSAILEAAKIANWEDSGGAPKPLLNNLPTL